MKEYVGKKMIADRDNEGGGVYFKEDSLEWRPRKYQYQGKAFTVSYADIVSYDVVATHKKRINLHTESEVYYVDMYRVDTFLFWLDKALAEAKKPAEAPAIPAPAPEALPPAEEVTPEPKADPIEALTKLAALHEAGALTDDEFAAMKAKIIHGE